MSTYCFSENQCIDQFSSAKKEGSLTSALTDIFAFFPAHTFASTEEMKIWDDDAAALEQAASGGYKKQLAIQRQWYTDSKSVSGE